MQKTTLVNVDSDESSLPRFHGSGGFDPAVEGGPATLVADEEDTADAPTRVGRMPPWRVLLHNDDVNVMEDVILALQEITKLTYTEAMQRMLEAHQTGLALLITTHREHAEFLMEQFESKLLTVTIEPEC